MLSLELYLTWNLLLQSAHLIASTQYQPADLLPVEQLIIGVNLTADDWLLSDFELLIRDQ